MSDDSGPNAMRLAIEHYEALTLKARVEIVDPETGELASMSLAEHSKRVDAVKAEVKRLMRANHEKRVQLEGMPAIRLQPGGGTGRYVWSVDAWYRNDHDRDDLIATILAGACAIDAKKAGELSGNGDIPATWKRYGQELGRDDALVWEKS